LPPLLLVVLSPKRKFIGGPHLLWQARIAPVPEGFCPRRRCSIFRTMVGLMPDFPFMLHLRRSLRRLVLCDLSCTLNVGLLRARYAFTGLFNYRAFEGSCFVVNGDVRCPRPPPSCLPTVYSEWPRCSAPPCFQARVMSRLLRCCRGLSFSF